MLLGQGSIAQVAKSFDQRMQRQKSAEHGAQQMTGARHIQHMTMAATNASRTGMAVTL